MRKLLILFCCLFPFVIQAQIITTFAGNGLAGSSGDGGPATAASIEYPVSGSFDDLGNYYFGLGNVGHCVRKISPTGIITTVAGNGVPGYSGDNGPATAAQLKNVQAVCIDNYGNLFIADATNNRIRKVDKFTHTITTVAGNGIGGYNGDNIAATTAQIFGPLGLCFDKNNNLYIADYGNNRVRKVNTLGIITTIVGTGYPINSPGGGLADTTPILPPSDVCVDIHDNIYIANWHSRVYKLTTNGYINTIAGNGIPGFGGDNSPATSAKVIPNKIVVDKYGNLIIADYDQERIRLVNDKGYISTISGNGITSFGGDNGPAYAGQFNHPAGISLDSCGNIYIADSRNWRIRKITYAKCHQLDASEMQEQVTGTSIYPNPVNDLLHIDGINTTTTYRLLSIVGASLQQGTLQPGSNAISTATLPPGIYLLELTDENKRTITKILKQ